MLEKMKKLAKLRAEAQTAATAKQDAEASAKATPQWEAYQAASETAAILRRAAEDMEAEIKAEAAANFDGVNKKPCVGLEIKAFTVARIPDEQAAKAWAMTNYTPALKLDTKAIEKAAKDGQTPAGLVEVATEYRAQLASDLSGYLE